MRTLRFLGKEALHLITAPETILLMLLFPLVLTWVLGTAFSSTSGQVIDLPEVKVPIVSDGSMLSDVFIANGQEAGSPLKNGAGGGEPPCGRGNT